MELYASLAVLGQLPLRWEVLVDYIVEVDVLEVVVWPVEVFLTSLQFLCP